MQPKNTTKDCFKFLNQKPKTVSLIALINHSIVNALSYILLLNAAKNIILSNKFSLSLPFHEWHGASPLTEMYHTQ